MIRKIRLRHVLPIGALALAVMGGGTAYAVTAQTATTIPPGTLHGCVAGTTRTLEHVYTNNTSGTTCPTGSFLVYWNVTGKQGPPGNDAILTVSAQTVVTKWPESSGWAVDNFTRNVTLTREGSVPASDCGAAASSCYLYTETLADNGGFTTVDGHASPNGSSTATIKGAWMGTMTGGGKLEFYASSSTPDPKLVPGTANGSAKPSGTTSWYKLFFSPGTQFGLTSGTNVPWLAYDWEYGASITCGTNNVISQHWSDAINPGDDGQGSSDGNITGATACIG